MDELTLLLSFLLTLHLLASGISSTTFTIVNQCKFTVWPVAFSNAGSAAISPTGFVLHTGDSRAIEPPANWSGRFWGRTGCNVTSSGEFSCATGDCKSGKVECDDEGPYTQPNTLVEFSLNDVDNLDFFDVSLVQGYNLPVMVVPGDPSVLDCTSTGCIVDVNGLCPPELRLYSYNEQGSNVVACKSACVAFASDQYCCTGNYSGNLCKPNDYSKFFKSACPRAYSYAFDDATSIFSCPSANYTITFCPVSNSRTGSSLLVTDSTLVQ